MNHVYFIRVIGGTLNNCFMSKNSIAKNLTFFASFGSKMHYIWHGQDTRGGNHAPVLDSEARSAAENDGNSRSAYRTISTYSY